MTEPRATCELRLPDADRFYDNIKMNAAGADVIGAQSRAGRRLIICGAGPSLVEIRKGQHSPDVLVWAANSALPTLWDWGIWPTHGVTVDQNLALLDDAEWGRALPVTYYVPSSIHPDVVAHLRKHKRRVVFFHSLVGIPDPEGWSPPTDWKGAIDGRGNHDRSYEMYLYTTLYPVSIMAGHGLNTVPRAICLAMGMGFDHVTVYGADCACAVNSAAMPQHQEHEQYQPWLETIQMYADGRSPSVHGGIAMAEAVIDGRRWVTRPDMVISAVHLLDLEKAFPGRIALVGDTLPNAIRDKDAEWFKGMPRLGSPGVVTNFGVQTAGV